MDLGIARPPSSTTRHVSSSISQASALADHHPPTSSTLSDGQPLQSVWRRLPSSNSYLSTQVHTMPSRLANNWNSQSSHPYPLQDRSTRRQRSAIACSYCRRRKIRCSGFEEAEDGRCKNCQRFSQDCTFVPVSAKPMAFVPAHAAYRRGQAPPIQYYGAYGQPLPLSQYPQGNLCTVSPQSAATMPSSHSYHRQHNPAPCMARNPAWREPANTFRHNRVNND